MDKFKNLIITDIHAPQIVHSKRGRKVQIKNRNSFGLSLCINGQITYTINGKTFVSTKETAVILPQGGNYTLYGEKDGLFPLVNFHCEGFSCDEILVIPLQNPQTCLLCFEALKKQYCDGQNHFQIFSLFYKLLDEISSKQGLKNPLLPRAIQHIEQNLSLTTLTNAAVANALDISEVYLRKLFITHLGTTPKQHILELRMQKAMQLLTDTPFTVTAISEKCGFSSVYHFSKEFKQKTGMTPTQYAERNKLYEI